MDQSDVEDLELERHMEERAERRHLSLLEREHLLHDIAQVAFSYRRANFVENVIKMLMPRLLYALDADNRDDFFTHLHMNLGSAGECEEYTHQVWLHTRK